MRLKRFIPSIGIVALAISGGVAIATTSSSSAAPVAHAAAAELEGAGSTLVAPMVEKVFGPGFKSADGITVNYHSLGSSAGIADITNGSVDFGASDAPLDEEQAKNCGGCVELPWALSATGLSYNLEGVMELKLSGTVIAEIFLGKITNWADPKIKALNPGVSLPSEKITPVRRSDGSGDTYVFTRYLSEVDHEWGSTVGFGTVVNWPSLDQSGKGNSGVAAVVKSTAGAIGNNSFFYIRETPGLSAVKVQNKAGYFQYPYVPNDEQAALASLTGRKIPSLNSLSGNANSIEQALSIVNTPFQKVAKGHKPTTLQHEEANAYPMATFTYILVRPDRPEISNLKKFVEYAIKPETEKQGEKYAFGALPPAVESADKAALGAL